MLEHDISGLAGAQAMMAQAGRQGARAVGAANGAGADRIAEAAESEIASRGWGNTSTVRARRGSGGASDPNAYVFLEGGAAWQEEGTSTIAPRPIVGPLADRMVEGIAEDAAERVARLF